MQTVYVLRTRYALPGIVSLVAAMLLTAPAEAIPLSRMLLHVPNGQLTHTGLSLALFALLFLPVEQVWRRWLSRRPSLVLVPGGRMPGTPSSSAGSTSIRSSSPMTEQR